MKYFRFVLVLWMTSLSYGAPLDPSPKTQTPSASAAVAPKWTLKDVDGREIGSAQYQGKVVLIHFWATWNARSREAIPNLLALQRQYGDDGLVVLGISLDKRDSAHVKHFAEAHGINYTIALANAPLPQEFGDCENPPITLLIERHGRIIQRTVGSWPRIQYEKLIQRCLSK